MDNFYTIRFKRNTAKRFKRFSKKVSKSYSETMELIINFFEWHGFLPSDRFERSIVQEVIKNRKRSEAIIAIIKDIEKSQTKPTNAMLLSLFEEKLVEEEPKFVERKFMEENFEAETIENLTVPKIQHEHLQGKMNAIKQDFAYVLDKVKTVKGGFSKGYLKLELTEEELIKYRRRLNKL